MILNKTCQPHKKYGHLGFKASIGEGLMNGSERGRTEGKKQNKKQSGEGNLDPKKMLYKFGKHSPLRKGQNRERILPLRWAPAGGFPKHRPGIET